MVYVWDGAHIIAEYTNGSLTKKYIYGPGMDNPVAMINVSGTNETWYYYYADALGSIRLLSDAGGAIVESYAYLAFGQPTVMTNAGTDGNWLTEDGTTINTSAYGNPYLFTARRWDFYTQLYYYRFRDYSPLIGRFLQPDPLGYIDSLNLYAYVNNNPLNWIDPFGLERFPTWWVPASDKAAFELWLESVYKKDVLGYGPANNLTPDQTRTAYQDWVGQGRPKVGKPKGWGRGGRGGRGGFVSKGMLGRLGTGIGLYLGYLGMEWIDQNHFDLDGQEGFNIRPFFTPTMQTLPDNYGSPKECQKLGDFPPLIPPGGGGYA